VVRGELLEREEVAVGDREIRRACEPGAAPSEEVLAPQLLGVYGRVRVHWRLRRIGSRHAVLVTPVDRVLLFTPRCRRVDSVVREDVAGVVQHDVEDDVDATRMSLVHQRVQVPVGRRRGVGSEARLDGQEVLDAVAVVRVVIPLAVLLHRREPKGADPELLEVVEARAHPVERASLEAGVVGVPPATRGRGRVVEAVDHEEVDPHVPPVRGRGKGRGRNDSGVATNQAQRRRPYTGMSFRA
jgi:hypothetical protein